LASTDTWGSGVDVEDAVNLFEMSDEDFEALCVRLGDQP
jgi:hypothetical protein